MQQKIIFERVERAEAERLKRSSVDADQLQVEDELRVGRNSENKDSRFVCPTLAFCCRDELKNLLANRVVVIRKRFEMKN